MSTIIVAWFLSYTIATQEWPVVWGPYYSRQECWNALEVVVVEHPDAFCSYMAIADKQESPSKP